MFVKAFTITVFVWKLILILILNENINTVHVLKSGENSEYLIKAHFNYLCAGIRYILLFDELEQ